VRRIRERPRVGARYISTRLAFHAINVIAGRESSDEMTRTAQLAAFVSRTGFDDIPEPVRTASKRIILDTIGCAIGALATEVGTETVAAAAAQGKGNATILGAREKVSPAAAAYANGRLGNILDIDECYMIQGHHAQAALGAALAIAEERKLSGAELIAAFAVGFEIGIRLGYYFTPRVPVSTDGKALGWTGLVGPSQGVHAALASVSNLLHTAPEKIAHGLGMAPQYSVHRAWSPQWGKQLDLGTIKYADTGWNAQGGLVAALSAAHGVTGIADIFDTDAYQNVFPEAVFTPAALTDGLGQVWNVQNTSIKFWPCCRWIHYALTAFDIVMRDQQLSCDDIEHVQLRSFPLIRYPRFSDGSDPSNLVAATFSFHHAAAMVALGVPPGPEWFTAENMSGDAARAMRAKIELIHDPLGDDPGNWGQENRELKVPSSVVVHAKGQTFEQRSDYAKGDPWSGAPEITEHDYVAKFTILAAAAGMAPEAMEALVGAVLNLETVGDVGDMLALTRI
jgi:2-methylcitrate dehydratase PrpD